MSAKLVVTLLATSLLTVGCVAYTDEPYYRGGYGYHDHDDDRYDSNDGRRYSDWERKRWEERKRIYEQQRKDAREQDRNRREWEKRHREWEKKRLEDRDHNHRDYHDDD
ncbi:MAG: hypothetical protein E6657_00415 [Acinetobacter sp.]|nr:hypothetical protein [Acinetobacter sp.]